MSPKTVFILLEDVYTLGGTDAAGGVEIEATSSRGFNAWSQRTQREAHKGHKAY